MPTCCLDSVPPKNETVPEIFAQESKSNSHFSSYLGKFLKYTLVKQDLSLKEVTAEISKASC